MVVVFEEEELLNSLNQALEFRVAYFLELESLLVFLPVENRQLRKTNAFIGTDTSHQVDYSSLDSVFDTFVYLHLVEALILVDQCFVVAEFLVLNGFLNHGHQFSESDSCKLLRIVELEKQSTAVFASWYRVGYSLFVHEADQVMWL